MSRAVLPSDKLDLQRLTVLIVDDNVASLDILSQAVSGYGMRKIFKCPSAKDARQIVRQNTIDLLIVDAQMPDEDGYELLRWIRREGSDANKFVPAIMCTSHTPVSQVQAARDCGAHFIVAKPITPKILLERIFWVAREERPFVDCDVYVGPDRRFKRMGPPAGMDGRRHDDVNGVIGDAVEPNLSQDEINNLMKPAKVML